MIVFNSFAFKWHACLVIEKKSECYLTSQRRHTLNSLEFLFLIELQYKSKLEINKGDTIELEASEPKWFNSDYNQYGVNLFMTRDLQLFDISTNKNTQMHHHSIMFYIYLLSRILNLNKLKIIINCEISVFSRKIKI